MQYRKFGDTDMEVSVVGFGCWQIGGYYWGHVDQGEWIDSVHRALDLGITLFDTADFYGFGRSEQVLAEALGDRSDDVIIATKVGLVSRGGRQDFGADDLPALEDHIEKDLSRTHIIEAAEASLRRLKRDVIDLYLLHWPDQATPVEETMGAMAELVEAGKVREVGCCNFSAAEMHEANRSYHLAAHQFPYSLLDRTAEQELLPACQAAGIGGIAYWTLFKGLLTGKYTQHSAFGVDDWRHFDPAFQGEPFRKSLAIVADLKRVAVDEGLSPAQLAIAWVLHQPGVTTAIVGAKWPQHVETNVGAAEAVLSNDALKRIDEILQESRA